MSTATADQIMATIKQDIDQMEKSRIWPFSCYAVVKDATGECINGLFDVSPEELRMNYLLNRANPSVYTDSVQILSQKVNEARQRLRTESNRDQIYQEYLNGGTPNPSGKIDLSWLTIAGKRAESTAAFGSTFGSTNQTSAFGSNPFSSTPAVNPFGSTVQTPTAFGKQNSSSGFGSSSFGSGQTSSGFGSNPFAATNPSNSPFGATNNTNPFQSSGSTGFATATPTSTPNANPFQQTAPPMAQSNQPAAAGNPFAATNAESVFGRTLPVEQKDQVFGQDDSIIYTPIEKLTQSEIEAFQADKFTFENLPINPPPKEACVR